MTNTMLIVGASGVIGAPAIEHISRLEGWKVIGMSRRRPDVAADTVFEHLSVDLQDAQACEVAAKNLSSVTHVVYAALFEKPGLMAGWLEADQMQTNLAMMKNLMGPLLAAAKGLQHVSVLQGTKAYGVHVHAFAVPGRESSPRDDHENFYWLQEDYMRASQRGAAWGLTIWRPQVVFGAATGVAMNLIPIIGAYAAICRELSLPFMCPDTTQAVFEAVDADLIAQALAWGAQSPAARNQTFNITNGDIIVWRNVWPSVAAAVGLEPAYGESISLSAFLLDHAAVWDRIVQRENLRPISMANLVGESHHYADMIFHYAAVEPPAPMLVSTIKLRQAGFADCIDTQDMLTKWLGRSVEMGILPRPSSPRLSTSR